MDKFRIENGAIITCKCKIKSQDLKKFLTKNLDNFGNNAVVLILIGVQSSSDEGLGNQDVILAESFLLAVEQIKKECKKILEEKNISIDVFDIQAIVKSDALGGKKINLAPLVKTIEECKPDILINATYFSDVIELNSMLRAEGIYANLIINSDMKDLHGKKINPDLCQKRFIKEFVEKKPKNVLVTGPIGSGQNLFLSQLLAITASQFETRNIPYRVIVMEDSGNEDKEIILEYLRNNYFSFLENEINGRKTKKVELIFEKLSNMMVSYNIVPHTLEDIEVIKKLVSEGKILDKNGWFNDEVKAPSISDILMDTADYVPASLSEDQILELLNFQSNFLGTVTTDWLMIELTTQFTPISNEDFVGILRLARQKWLNYLFWIEHQAQNSERNMSISVKLDRLLASIAKEQPNVKTIVMISGFQLDYGAALFDKKESIILDWKPNVPENIHLFVGVDPMSWQDFELPFFQENKTGCDSMFFFLSDKYRNSEGFDTLIADIGSDYNLPSALKELDGRSHIFMPKGLKPGWLKIDSIEKDRGVLMKALADRTADYTNIHWTCSCPSDFKKFLFVCNENWEYVPYVGLNEASMECIIIFGVPTSKCKRTIQRKLVQLISSAKKSITIVTERESKPKQKLAIKILQNSIEHEKLIALQGIEADKMISIIKNQQHNLVKEEFYISSDIQREKVIEFIKTSSDELWNWTNTKPEGMRIFIKNFSLLAAALQRIKNTIDGKDSFLGIIKQFEEGKKNILHILSGFGSYSNDRFSSIFDMLQYVKPNGSEYKPEPKRNKLMIEFIKHSIHPQWTWVNVNPRGILYFSSSAEVLGAILQRLKDVNIFKLISVPAIIQHFEKDDRTILHHLTLDPWNDDQLSSIMDVLGYGVTSHKIDFNLNAKENIVEFIEKSNESHWKWIESKPKGLSFFCNDIDVLVTLVDKIQDQLFLSQILFDENNTILHLLSQAPLSERQMNLVLIFLQKGVKPDHINDKGMNFLQLSPIKPRLCQKIETVIDDWCSDMLNVWTNMAEVFESWINLEDDEVLSKVLKRMKEYTKSSGERNTTFDPFNFARVMWSKKSKLPESFKQFLSWTAMYHHYDETTLMLSSRKHLCYVKYTKNERSDDISLLFYTAIKEHIFKKPTLGYYIKQLLTSFTLITLIFRSIDAITDFTLTFDYFNNFETETSIENGTSTILQEYLDQTLCQIQPCDYNHWIQFCETKGKNTPACFFPNLKRYWLPGMFSAIILLITWLAESLTITIQMKKGNQHFENYCEVFTRACCKKHRSVLIYTAGFILPLTQQITSLIYKHWINTFVKYWKERPNQLIESSDKKEICAKCNKCRDSDLKVCLYCSKNVNDLEQLDTFNENANRVADHSRTVIASTENLFMPMIQLSFLFPSILFWFSTNLKAEKSDNQSTGNLPEIIEVISVNWTTLLTVFSTLSSLISLAGSQTSIYFAAPGKRNQKTLSTRAFVFLTILLQVLPKILSFQVFAFGVIISKFGNPDAIFYVLFFLPIISSSLKVFIIWLSSCFQLEWKMIWKLLLSPFMFTRISKTNEKKNDIEMGQKSNTSSCHITENGKYHILFDIMSLVENCLFTFIGGKYINEAEETFQNWIFFASVIGTHMFGLLLKLLYYKHQHPWMSLSDAYKTIEKVVNGVLLLLVVCIVIGMPVSVLLFELNSKYSSLLYTLFGLSVIMIIVFIINMCSNTEYARQ